MPSIAAEIWQRLADAYSCQIVIESPKGKPAPVRAMQLGGCLYTVFSIIYGAYGATIRPRIEAWKLLPLEMYQGETTLVYHDEAAIRAGLRRRGDHTGLIVSVNGKRMVCAEMVEFVMDLPTTRPLSLVEAKDYDERQRSSGWRALWFKGKEPEWFSLQGHPVAVYRDHSTLGDDNAVLLWRSDGEILELSIANDIELSPLGGEAENSILPPVQEGQLALF